MDQDPKVELAAIREQLVFIKEGVDEVKVSVSKLLSIDRAVAALEVKNTGHDEKIADITERVEALEQRQSNNTAYINKLRGGISLSVTIVGIMQSAILAAACWLLSSVIDLHNEVTATSTELRYLKQEHERVLGAALPHVEVK